jgi:hypothetical protein
MQTYALECVYSWSNLDANSILFPGATLSFLVAQDSHYPALFQMTIIYLSLPLTADSVERKNGATV